MSPTPLQSFKSRVMKIDYTNPYRVKAEIERIRMTISAATSDLEKAYLLQEIRLMGKLLVKQPIRSQAMILKGNSFLLIKCLGKQRQDIFYTLPGGGLMHGESSEDALHREIFEELGVLVKIQKRLPDYINEGDDDFYIRYHTYLCHLVGEVPSKFSGLETHTEILEPLWVPLDAIAEFENSTSEKLQIWPDINAIVQTVIPKK